MATAGGDDAITEPLAWGVASRALEGTECGDLSWVIPRADGVLLAVVDGLGHGARAAVAARAAGRVLCAHADLDVTELVERCHGALRNTRGAAMTLASIDPAESRMTWLGVGTVRGIVWRADSSGADDNGRVVLAAGVVGHELPSLRPITVSLQNGDTVVLATDGVHRDFTEDIIRAEVPARAADRVLQKYATGTDDALVLVASYRHGSP